MNAPCEAVAGSLAVWYFPDFDAGGLGSAYPTREGDFYYPREYCFEGIQTGSVKLIFKSDLCFRPHSVEIDRQAHSPSTSRDWVTVFAPRAIRASGSKHHKKE